ncbi:UDP-N-acetylmuramate dehydrogenase [Vibrio cyclitrophicus]|uniref:UDP-N-acetylmuramate dehydrogenase n=2 Tax=Vibrio TaxID=662 RepID=UPI00030AC6A9|nr:UDP-N-acetylmuramate dehydrogenase [Vibrio cyclitrophicus]
MLNDVLLSDIAEKFVEKKFGTVIFDFDLSKKSYWNIGSVAKAVFYVNSIGSVEFLVEKFNKSSIKYHVIGNSTNLLFDDKSEDLVLIIFSTSFSSISYGDFITVNSGMSCPRLAMILSKKGYTGIEHIVGIPGTIGGLVYMNGGSNRHSISEVINSVICFDIEKGIVRISKDECDFSYRKSIFQEKKLIILSVELNLDKDKDKDNNPWKDCKVILKQRSAKFPLKYPNCGSVFISNKVNYEVKGPPGYIIECLGLKGLTIGGAQISNLHGNFIINKGGAKTDDVISLIRTISDRAKKEYGIILESEVLFISDGIVSPVTNLI